MRARTCSLLFGRGSSKPYVLNLIDTPGVCGCTRCLFDLLCVHSPSPYSVGDCFSFCQVRRKTPSRSAFAVLGHADFSFEVKRSLVASDGCVLLVDASQGPQAQTYAHLQKALDRGLPVIAALNKVSVFAALVLWLGFCALQYLWTYGSKVLV